MDKDMGSKMRYHSKLPHHLNCPTMEWAALKRTMSINSSSNGAALSHLVEGDRCGIHVPWGQTNVV